MTTAYHIDLGIMPYRQARLVQALAQKAVLASQHSGARPITAILLTCQHPPVVTFGKNSTPEHLIASEAELSASGIDLVTTDRGGEVTAHNPGQLVVYPILYLPALKMMAKAYIHALEQSVINLLSHYDLAGTRDAQHPGIWIGEDKICAVGVRFSRRVSLHGLALNVSNDLSMFTKMTPCGIAGRGVTSISAQPHRLAPSANPMATVTTQFVRAFAKVFAIVPVCLPLSRLLDRRLPEHAFDRS